MNIYTVVPSYKHTPATPQHILYKQLFVLIAVNKITTLIPHTTHQLYVCVCVWHYSCDYYHVQAVLL